MAAEQARMLVGGDGAVGERAVLLERVLGPFRVRPVAAAHEEVARRTGETVWLLVGEGGEPDLPAYVLARLHLEGRMPAAREPRREAVAAVHELHEHRHPHRRELHHT